MFLACASPAQVTQVEPPRPAAVLTRVQPRIVAGGYRTCVLSETGEVTCWGYDIPRPTKIRGLEMVTDLALGELHACARQQTGAVVCWGSNADGELGDGTTTDRATPTPVVGLAPVVEIATGARHTCARHADGGVSCWGAGITGQLGDGARKDRLQPVRVAGITDAIGIAAGATFACALHQHGGVTCWGDNSVGSLGVERSKLDRGVEVLPNDDEHFDEVAPFGDERWIATLPLENPAIHDARVLTASGFHACVVRSTGIVTCWGKDAMRGSAEAMRDIDEARNATAIATGGRYTCARESSRLICWGERRMQRIIESIEYQSPQHTAIAEGTQFAVGTEHVCTLAPTGAIACWGNNAVHQLGAPTTTNRYLRSVTSVQGAAQLSTTYSHSCALVGGKVECWTPVIDSVPRAMRGIEDATQIASGAQYTCAVVAGKVRCVTGVLDKQILTVVGALDDAVEVTVAASRGCARRVSGSVACWDLNRFMLASPIDVRDAAQVSSGVMFTCIRHTTGAVSCSGANNDVLPDQVAITAVDEIAAGATHVCARKGGTVWCWGTNEFGQLGDGTKISRATPARVAGIEDAVALSNGTADHTCAIRRSGQVACWGRNGSSQQALDVVPGGLEKSRFRTLPTDVPHLDDIRAVTVSMYESCAQRKSGEVVCWPSLINPQTDLRGSDGPVTVTLDR